jgi:hypothetical protein
MTLVKNSSHLQNVLTGFSGTITHVNSPAGIKHHTQLLQYIFNKHNHRWGIRLWMQCDSETDHWLASKYIEGIDAIQIYGLEHAVVMKSLEMEVTTAKAIIFLWTVFYDTPTC